MPLCACCFADKYGQARDDQYRDRQIHKACKEQSYYEHRENYEAEYKSGDPPRHPYAYHPDLTYYSQ